MGNKQRARAKQFLALHHKGRPLLLPNAWDVASAAMFVKAGASAIGTTSAGIAFSLGYADGQRVSQRDVLDVHRRIASHVDVPVSADIESGYSKTTDELSAFIKELVRTGVVGVNIEDAAPGSPGTLISTDRQVEVIKTVRQAAADMDIHLVINARTDVYWQSLGKPEERLSITLRRLHAYEQAGADCLFVPGLNDADVIRLLIKDITLPLNILAGPKTPSVATLAQLGVHRVSVGSGPVRAMMSLVEAMGQELFQKGTYTFSRDIIDYKKANELF